MTTKINLILDQGADFLTTFNLQAANGAVLDLSTYTGVCKMRKTYTSVNATSFTVSLTNTGIVSMSMPYAQTAILIPGRYLYDIEITSSANTVTRIIEGIIDVSATMTR